MLNPKIVYIAVVMVFAYIVVKFKLIPYLAAKKILKDAKKDGAQQAQAMPAPLLPAQINPALQPYLALNGCALPPVPADNGRQKRHDMYFDYRIVETIRMDEDPISFEDEAKRVDLTVNSLIVDLRKRGICPGMLDIVQISDGPLMVYATYIL